MMAGGASNSSDFNSTKVQFGVKPQPARPLKIDLISIPLRYNLEIFYDKNGRLVTEFQFH